MSRMAELDIVRQEHNIPVDTPNLLDLLVRIADQKGKCIWCNEQFVYKPATRAGLFLITEKGQIYSELGLQEVRISGSCEYCFDEMFTDTVKDEYDIDENCPVCGDPPDYCLGNHPKPDEF